MKATQSNEIVIETTLICNTPAKQCLIDYHKHVYAVCNWGNKKEYGKRYKTKDKKICSGKTHLAAFLISKEYLSSK